MMVAASVKKIILGILVALMMPWLIGYGATKIYKIVYPIKNVKESVKGSSLEVQAKSILAVAKNKHRVLMIVYIIAIVVLLFASFFVQASWLRIALLLASLLCCYFAFFHHGHYSAYQEASAMPARH